MGKPNERERDLIIQLQENTYQQQNHNFQPRKIDLQHTKVVPKIYLEIHAKSVMSYDPPCTSFPYCMDYGTKIEAYFSGTDFVL